MPGWTSSLWSSMEHRNTAISISFPTTGLVGLYAEGNESGFHIPYLYDFFGQPLKTQQRVRMLMVLFEWRMGKSSRSLRTMFWHRTVHPVRAVERKEP